MRLPAVLAVTAGSLVLAVGPAFATSPHFINASASGPSRSGTLSVNFKEAGLGNDALISYQADANASATYACINGGGNHPQAKNKETVAGPVSAFGTFSSDKNGSISNSLTLNPPGAGDFSCPSGQRLVLASVSYSDVSITDTTDGITASIAGVFSATFFAV